MGYESNFCLTIALVFSLSFSQILCIDSLKRCVARKRGAEERRREMSVLLKHYGWCCLVFKV